MSPAARPFELPRLAVYETDALTHALDVAGAAIVPGALPPQLCERTRAEIDRLAPLHWDEAHGDPRRIGGGRHLDRYLCVFNRDPYWLQLIDRPGIIDLAEKALGEDCHIVGMTAWRSHPGFRGEPLHVDYQPLTWPDGALPDTVRVPAYIVTVHYYLTDVAPELAPTRIIPGSHRAGRVPGPGEASWRGAEARPVLAQAGDALVFRSDVWHAGSDNVTREAVRYLLQVHYGRREMAQHFSPFMEWRHNPAVLEAATRRQKRLLGDHDAAAYD